ncbi:hypothetical protein MG293_016220 [Ovis ammon polii]|uniref:Uncharacterized protein n=1 Tax=Ovis ammon polii TaxID=230172 RepID=A0AAD4Y4J8_OVIAM|nr:hypothetical protein MG293_016220 [Ovis ammon polii]
MGDTEKTMVRCPLKSLTTTTEVTDSRHEYLPMSPGFPSHRGPFRPPRGDAILELLLLQIQSVTICDSPPVPSAFTPPRPQAVRNIPSDFLPFSLPERVRHQLSLSPAGRIQRPRHHHQDQAG